MGEIRETEQQTLFARKFFPFPVFTGVMLVLLVFSLVQWHELEWFMQLPNLLNDYRFALGGRMTIWIITPVAVPLYFLTFWEHIRPFGVRRRKYDYALALAGTLWVGQVFLNTVIGNVSPLSMLIQPLLAFGFAVAMSALLIRVCKPSEIPGRFGMQLHRWTKTVFGWPVVVLLTIFLPKALIVFLVLRYRTVQWMENCPIVYLRSFSQENAPLVFQKVVTSPANKLGVLTALVHKTQSGSELKKGRATLEGSQLTASSDEKWKEWVLSEIKIASAIIIDHSIATEGITWEVEQATKNCDPDRIAILVRSGNTREFPNSHFIIEYSDSQKGYRKARQDLQEWLITRMFA